VQEVAGALDNLHPRPGREVTPGVLHEGQTDAAVTVPVQVQSRLRPAAYGVHAATAAVMLAAAALLFT
jgi:hypothetical protein